MRINQLFKISDHDHFDKILEKIRANDWICKIDERVSIEKDKCFIKVINRKDASDDFMIRIFRKDLEKLKCELRKDRIKAL